MNPRYRWAMIAVWTLAMAWEAPLMSQTTSGTWIPLDGRLQGELARADSGTLSNHSSVSTASNFVTRSAADSSPQNASTDNQHGCTTCCRGLWVDWRHYPSTIRPMPRPGDFPVPPKTGPAYFTVLDALTGNCRENSRKPGYAPFAINAWSFYDADWRFVESMAPSDRNLVERLKRIHLNDCWLLSTGGEYWIKYHHEQNSRLTETRNDFTQYHFRMFTDWWYRDRLRIYGEFIWADVDGQELAPLPPDIDRGDLHNLFLDLKLFEVCGKPVFVRGGRQELLYGSQRLVTPLPWANKRNAFDGVKIFRNGEKWDFDLFWSQFVPPNANQFDQSDADRMLAGTWLTYKPQPGHFVDLYYLHFDNDLNIAQQNIARAPLSNHTMGSRWTGDRAGRLWDFEGAVQFGEQAGEDLLAAMVTAGLGRNWSRGCWSPTVWAYYDYASGDSDPSSGTARTFNHLFPFGHYYLGWADAVGRQNIHDLNGHLFLYPARWCTVWLQYHHFRLAQPRDALYNAGGVAIRQDASGNSGTHVGDEVDVVLNFHVTNYSDVLVSYNKLFGGAFLENTATSNQASETEALYLMYHQRW